MEGPVCWQHTKQPPSHQKRVEKPEPNIHASELRQRFVNGRSCDLSPLKGEKRE